MTLNHNLLNQRHYLLQQPRRMASPFFGESHTTTRTTSSTTILSDGYLFNSNLNKNDSVTNIGESFMFRTSPKRLQQCHILIQVYFSNLYLKA